MQNAANPKTNGCLGCLGCFGFLMVVFIMIGGCGIIMMSHTDSKNATEPKTKLEKNAKNALNQIGIYKYEIKKDAALDGAAGDGTLGYRVTTEFSNGFVILYANTDETIHSIRYADKDYYLKGKVLSSIQDDVLTLDEAENYKRNAEVKVKEILKAPSTAKFPNIKEWGFSKKKGIVTIQGHVDSQNSFGAMLRSDFQIKYNEKEGYMTSFIFDGEELIKSKSKKSKN